MLSATHCAVLGNQTARQGELKSAIDSLAGDVE